MALTLDATPGGEDANSYCLVLEADRYNAYNLYATAWAAATSDQKIATLVMATRMLNELVEWSGFKTTLEQALRWPRGGVIDRDGYSIDNDVIPQFLKDATAELARYLLSSDRQTTLDAAVTGIKSVKADTVEVVFDKMDRANAIPDSVMAMINFYASQVSGDMVVKLERA